MSQKPDPQWLRQQVEAYAKELSLYKTYAEAMKRVLELARKPAVPQAIVEARAKSIASFAEKCVRKHPKYLDPVHQLTDLCGARIIVQTLGQVQAAHLFVDCNFEVVDREDKTMGLGDDKFGYRDMHYLVRLRRERAMAIGFTADECDVIGDRIAELQVRSLVQHAWADILHDRMYKAPLRLSAEARRTGALLAAIMEDGDRSFDRLASEIDGMVANYAAYANRQDVDAEVARQERILDNVTEPEARASTVLQLARLYGSCGDYAKALAILEPLERDESSSRWALMCELGHARCRVHLDKPMSIEYRSGQALLARVVENCRGTRHTVIPDLRQRTSLHARALSRLAWSESEENKVAARDLYREALEIEPSNPYHLVNQLGFEIYCAHDRSMIASMRTTIRQGIETCRQHAVAGIELPFAAFTAARLSLLLGEPTQALGYYARGLRHLFDGDSCVQATVLVDELTWVKRLHEAEQPPKEHLWIERLIPLCQAFHEARTERQSGGAEPESDRRVLIVAGGARSIDAPTLARVTPCLQRGLAAFRGTVISGGTDVGIPGRVGKLWAQLREDRGSELVGYVPDPLPRGETRHPGYDRFEVCGQAEFSPEEILHTWDDLQKHGILPAHVLVLGFGGGPLSLVEYRVGLAMGASVAVLAGSRGAADTILADPMWSGVKSLIALPEDPASFQAIATVPTFAHVPTQLDAMARAFHGHYVRDNPGKLPANMRPWEKLHETFRTANLEQARYAVEILRAAGFDVRAKTGKADAITSFKGDEFKDDVERMAELEHGRWMIERLRDGWRYGPSRDDAKKIHDCLVKWRKRDKDDKEPDLPDAIREYNRNSIRAFPEILGIAGLEIVSV